MLTAGLDLGGTHVRGAMVTADGAVAAARTEAIRREGPPFAQLIALVRSLADEAGAAVAGVGIGVTGPVDAQRGWVENPHTLPPNLQGDLAGTVRAALGVEVAVVNDADAAALGEQRTRGAGTLVAVTVGTGVGVGVVRDGRVVQGAGGGHGEAGHMVIDPSGPPCYCGARGCLESLASGVAVAQVAGAPDGRAVAERAAAGDGEATAALDAARAAIATGVRNLVAVHAPEVVVLSGNALPDAARTRTQAQAAVDAFTMGGPVHAFVEASTLGDLAACLGAAALVTA